MATLAKHEQQGLDAPTPTPTRAITTGSKCIFMVSLSLYISLVCLPVSLGPCCFSLDIFLSLYLLSLGISVSVYLHTVPCELHTLPL